MMMRRYTQRAAPGTKPGTIHIPADALPPVIRITCYDSERIEHYQDCKVELIQKLLGKHAVTWIDIVGLGDAEIVQRVGESLGLHPLAMADVVNVPQRSKVEHYRDHVFLVTQLPRLSQSSHVEQISIFAGKDFVLSWRERPSDCFDTVRARIEETGPVIRQSSSDYLLYALLDTVIDTYFPTLEDIGDRLDLLDDEVSQGAASDLVVRVHGVRHDVRLLRRIVWPLREAVEMLSKNHEWFISKETSIYLRDCHDHTVQIIDTLENYREACAELRDLYATEISNRLNEVMKVLTIIATIFIPLSFIAGVYGMNFDPEVSDLNMPELKWHWGYPITLGLMLLVAVVQLMFFRWKGWLGKTTRKQEKT